MNGKFPSIGVLGSQVNILTLEDTIGVIRRFIEDPDGKCHYIVAVGFHSLWETHRDLFVHLILNSVDLWIPDGIAPVWLACLKGYKIACCIPCPNLMHEVLHSAEERDYRSFFYGDTTEKLGRLTENIQTKYCQHEIAGTLSPLFRSLIPEEDDEVVRTINKAKLHIIWVDLGMSKQDA